MHNGAAAQSLITLGNNNSRLNKALAKISSGMKINSAGDGAAEYAISERMRVQIRGLGQDVQNAQTGQNILRTAEGAAQSTIDILKTLKEKAINAANDHNTDLDRATIQKEVDELIDQIDHNANVSYNGKTLLNGQLPMIQIVCTDGLSGKQAAIVKGMYSEWMDLCLGLIEDSYGLSFDEAGTTIDTITVSFSDEPDSSALAYVSYTANSAGEATSLSLVVNMHYYDNFNTGDLNGDAGGGAGYLDRVLAHEMTHAAMAANINYFGDLPKYIVEGSAEYMHGIDDFRYGTILNYAMQSQYSNVSGVLNGTYDEGASAYAVGYSVLHYLTKTAAAATGNSQLQVMQDFINYLDNATGSAQANYDGALAACSGGLYGSEAALRQAYLNDLQSYGGTGTASAKAFLENYCGIYMDNEDTGSISGSDVGGSETKTAESIVPEQGPISSWTLPPEASTYYEDYGLTVIWPDSYMKDVGLLKLQIGTKAGQAMNILFGDLRAEALGIRYTDRSTVQVNPIENAEAAIALFDDALEVALGEQTTMGAAIARLDYTISNLTVMGENVQLSESTIRDADMAKEMVEYTKHNVLSQAAQSMLAQANQDISSVLSLLQ